MIEQPHLPADVQHGKGFVAAHVLWQSLGALHDSFAPPVPTRPPLLYPPIPKNPP